MAQTLRIERKYPLDPAQFQAFRQWHTRHGKVFRPSYPPRQVNNLYFDSVELDCFNENLAGQSRRAKCRLRWYGDSIPPEKYSFEVKRRRNMAGDKLRTFVGGDVVKLQTPTALYRSLRKAVDPGLKLYLDQTPSPTLLNRYQRGYYASHHGLRMTVDTNMAYRFYPANGFGKNHFQDSNIFAVIELKFALEQKELAEKLLTTFSFTPIKHSKYVTGIQHVLGV